MPTKVDTYEQDSINKIERGEIFTQEEAGKQFEHYAKLDEFLEALSPEGRRLFESRAMAEREFGPAPEPRSPEAKRLLFEHYRHSRDEYFIQLKTGGGDNHEAKDT